MIEHDDFLVYMTLAPATTLLRPTFAVASGLQLKQQYCLFLF